MGVANFARALCAQMVMLPWPPYLQNRSAAYELETVRAELTKQPCQMQEMAEGSKEEIEEQKQKV